VETICRFEKETSQKRQDQSRPDQTRPDYTRLHKTRQDQTKQDRTGLNKTKPFFISTSDLTVIEKDRVMFATPAKVTEVGRKGEITIIIKSFSLSDSRCSCNNERLLVLDETLHAKANQTKYLVIVL
jgi:thioredoxin reductase